MSRERDRSGDRAADRTEEKQYDPDPKVFVGGIPFSLSPEDIKELFEVHGPVVDMTLPRTLHDPRKHKGFAFITFDSFKTMDTVIHKMDGRELSSHQPGGKLTVSRATVNNFKRQYNNNYNQDGSGSGGGYYNSERGGRGSSYGGGGGYDAVQYGRDGGSRGGYGRDSRYDDRGAGGRYEGGSGRSSGYAPYDSRPSSGSYQKPIRIGYRCRVTGLAEDVDWRLLKDFLRQIGDVTYANVNEYGHGIGEYMTLDEVREAIDKLTGAAINGSVVKLTPLNFDMQTGEKFPLPGSDTHHSSDRQAPSSRYSMRSSGGGGYDGRSSRDGGGHYSDRRGGGYDGDAGRGSYSSRSYEGRSGGYGYGGSGRSGSDDVGRGGGYEGRGRERERSLDRGYERPAGGGRYGGSSAAGGGGYGGGGSAAAAGGVGGGSSRYGGATGSPGSLAGGGGYGGGAAPAAAAAAHGY